MKVYDHYEDVVVGVFISALLSLSLSAGQLLSHADELILSALSERIIALNSFDLD